MTQTCPECGHSILCHKRGLCQVIIRTKLWGMVECNCSAIQPPNHQPKQLTLDTVCKHGVAMDVHCCGCHSGFLFDIATCTCLNREVQP